jgi:hypothetical protein
MKNNAPKPPPPPPHTGRGILVNREPSLVRTRPVCDTVKPPPRPTPGGGGKGR